MTAIARPASITKQTFLDLSARGVTVKAMELSEISDALVEIPVEMDVVLECMTA